MKNNYTLLIYTFDQKYSQNEFNEHRISMSCRKLIFISILFQLWNVSFVSGKLQTDSLYKDESEETVLHNKVKKLIKFVENSYYTNPTKAIAEGNKARKILTDNFDQSEELWIDLWTWTGMAYHTLYKGDSIKTCALALENLSKINRSKRIIVYSNYLWSQYYFHKKNYSRAVVHDSVAFRSIDMGSESQLIHEILLSMARNLSYLPEPSLSKSDSLFSYLLEYAVKNNKQRLKGEVYYGIGGNFYERSQLNEATYYFDSAAQIQDLIGHFTALIQSYYINAHCYFNLGNYDESMIHAINSLEVAQSKNYYRGTNKALTILAQIYEEQGLYADAMKMWNQSIEISSENGFNDRIPMALERIGSLYLLLGDVDKAVDFIERSLALKKAANDKYGLVFSYYAMSNVLIAKQEFVEAERNLLQGLKIAREESFTLTYVSTLTSLGEVKKLQRKFEEAINYFDSALVTSESIKHNHLNIDIYRQKSEIFEQMGKFEKALFGYKKYIALKDSLYTSDSQQVISELQQKYKTKEQKQQIELLEKDKQFNQLAMFGLGFGLLLISGLSFVIYNRYKLKTRANEIIQIKSDQLEKSHVELKSLSEFKQGMTGMIAHDIKNPLNSIIGISERMEEKGSSKIAQASRMILQLVTNMLDVEKYEHTSPNIKVTRVLLSELMTEARLSVELLMHDKSITLRTDLQWDYQLEVDRDMIIRVFINLLSNAIKFAPSHSEITIQVSHQDKAEGSILKLSFTDKGKGIHQDDLSFVFDKFWQSDARHSGVASSTGLGLSFCKMAVMAHNGIIYAESEYEKSSTFIIELPIPNQINQRSVKPKKEKPVKSSISKDIEVLKPYATRLKELKVHQVSSIIAVLDEIEELNLNSTWTEEVKSAVIHSNKAEYENLLEMVEY